MAMVMVMIIIGDGDDDWYRNGDGGDDGDW